MKRKNLLLIIGCVGIIFLAIFVSMMRGAKLMARTDTVQAGIGSLAVTIESYREDHGRYPSSLEELLSGSHPETIEYIKQNQILHDLFNDKYEYQPLTNGFAIIVTSPSSWLINRDRIEKTFKIGEAFKQFRAP
jgi:type II secretory pathway pseudopilin PulG